MSEIEKGRNLPSLNELYEDTEMLVKQSKFIALINSEPNPKWIKENKFFTKKDVQNGKEIDVPSQEIPIERLQWLMYRIFGNYSREIKETAMIANSVRSIVRIHYKNPITGEWMYQDGTGAVPLQVNKKLAKNAIDWEFINPMSAMGVVPASVTYAEKNAIKQIGKLFGKDLNRFEESSYMVFMNQAHDTEVHNLKLELSRLIGECQDSEITDPIVDEITTAEAEGDVTPEMYKKWISRIKQ